MNLPWALYSAPFSATAPSISTSMAIGYSSLTTAWPEIFTIVPKSADPPPVEVNTFTTQGAAYVVGSGLYLALATFGNSSPTSGFYNFNIRTKPFIGGWETSSFGTPIFGDSGLSKLLSTSPLSVMTEANVLIWFHVRPPEASLSTSSRWVKQGFDALSGSYPRTLGGDFSLILVRIAKYVETDFFTS